MANITHIVIHYTATYADQDLHVADIDKMHKARGWKMIGYHWLITRDGTIEQGRPESMVGAHVANQNTGKIGISWVGGLDRKTGPDKGVDNRTDAQKDSLIKLITECLKRYPGAKVVGHRDLAATQCPGFDVRSWWANVQDAPEPVHTPGVGEDTVHIVAKGDTMWSIATEHGLTVAQLREYNPNIIGDVIWVGDAINLVKPKDTRAINTIIEEIQVLLDELKLSRA